MGPRGRQDGPKRAQTAPRWGQDGPRRVPRQAKAGQDREPRWAVWRPPPGKPRKKGLPDIPVLGPKPWVHLGAILGYRFGTSLLSWSDLQTILLGPSWNHIGIIFGASWIGSCQGHLGTIMALSWTILDHVGLLSQKCFELEVWPEWPEAVQNRVRFGHGS